ncbi:hypothetical protein [Bartonella rattaustraliani]|uniref:hypothetical protein n=1 Tax=Bartonella rattaustraliani TaxID=481139 RepID=UPI0002D7CAA1|nr:hypothetical protein [Bartonella rattaustraliani]
MLRAGGNALKSAPFMKGSLNPAHKPVSNKALRAVARELYDPEIPWYRYVFQEEKLPERFSFDAKNMFLTDMSPELNQLLYKSSATNKAVHDILEQAHGERLGGSFKRLRDTMDDTIAPYQHADDLKDILKQEGNLFSKSSYKKMRNTPIDKEYYEKLDPLFANARFRQALNHAVGVLNDDINRANPIKYNNKKFPHITYKPTMKLLDETKRSLDILYRKYSDSGDTSRANLYHSLKKRLLDITDEISPRYKTARGIVEKYKVFKETFDEGRKALGGDLPKNAIESNLARGNWSGGNTYKLGVRNELNNSVKTNSDTANKLSDLLKGGIAAENLKKIIGDESFASLKKAAHREGSYSKAAEKAYQEYQGRPKFSIWHGMTKDMGLWQKGLTLARNILHHPNSPEILAARQEIEREIAKLATFGVGEMKRPQIAKLMQNAVMLHAAGVLTDAGLQFISRAISKGLGPGFSIEYAK